MPSMTITDDNRELVSALFLLITGGSADRLLSAEQMILAAISELVQRRKIDAQIANTTDADYDEECPFCHAEPGYLPIVHVASCPVSRLRAMQPAHVE